MGGKLISGALFLTILGTLLLLPPLANVFQLQRRFFGLPAELIYLFACWGVLIAAAFWLSRRLPREAEAEPRNEDDT
ncbi:MAG: hypothetical protein EOP22_07795 [Hyphomicrobiales bacterium]|nr:MAG: hypothetical protein EOP22_07795 [Hyphomicrobiales bacterium]